MKLFIKKIIIKFKLYNIISIFFYIFRIFPIKNNKIVFVNFSGKGYGDSPKYILEYLNKNIYNLDLVWLCSNVNNNNNTFPSNVRLVKMFSIKSFYELTTARVWVNNSRFDAFVRKRQGQYYIQTWHGGLAFKKIEYDANEKLSDYYHDVMNNDNKLMDIMISNSKFCTEMYRRGFKFKGNILEVGTPRNDVLINNRNELSEKARNYLKVNDKEKILLYAPTFRLDYSKNPYDIDFSALKSTLEEMTNCNWKIVIKLHPRITNSKKLLKFDDDSIDATSYSDIQELICACDILITDYSSTMFEAMIADKPVLIYANDIDNYMDERGCYFSFNDLPFPLANNNNDLIDIIKNNDLNAMKKDYSKFEKKLGLTETGVACKKVIELIEKQIGFSEVK